MRARALLVTAALLAGGFSATAADAAPKKKKPAPPPPSCNLVKDPAGDSSNQLNGVAVWPADNGLDIVGADVASDAKNIAAVIRLAAAPGEANVYMKRYIAQFTVAGQQNPMLLAAAVTATGTSYSFGYYGPDSTGRIGFNYAPASAGTVTGSITEKVISLRVPLSAVAAYQNLGPIKSGAKISAFSITANRRLPGVAQAPGTVYAADDATSKSVYYAGKPSCLKAS